MPDKYDLDKMLEEIKEDIRVDGSKHRKISQQDIKDMIMARRKAPQGDGNRHD
jgi:hypothetical protein